MANNTGILLMVGLGALFFLGRCPKPAASEETVEGFGASTIVTATPQTSVVDDTSTLVIATTGVQLGSGEVITETEQAVRRSEQIQKQKFDWSAGVIPPATTGKIVVSQGDLDTIAMKAGEFEYGGAPRPTSTAKPRWSHKYGWWWMNPSSGRAVGPGGKEWTPGDTSVNMGASGTNIGKTLPPGWTQNRGGSADFTGIIEHDFSLA